MDAVNMLHSLLLIILPFHFLWLSQILSLPRKRLKPSLPLSFYFMIVILSAVLGNGKSRLNLPKLLWRVEILNAVDCNGEITKLTWRIENFSSVEHQKPYFENFSVDGNKWIILIFPKGNKNNMDHLSIYLGVADSATFPPGWSRFVQLEFAVIDQINRTNSITGVTTQEFKAKESGWGYTSFLALTELEDPTKGYLLNDACLVEAYISDKTEGLISHEFILATDLDKHKTKEADGVEEAINNQTVKTEPAIEPEDPTEEYMNTFFFRLESKLLSSKIVVSREEAKEAVAKLDEAMNMSPVDFFNSGMFSSLKQAFQILASFNYSSTTLTIGQKNVMLALEESLKELANRAVKAVEDKSHLSKKESVKQTITHNLDTILSRYKALESEVKQVEQKLVALHKQVEEAEKERENMLAERKELFRSSNKMQMELEALEKKWAEYEAKAEAAKKEEKTVEAEWGRMKDFISSIKGKI